MSILFGRGGVGRDNRARVSLSGPPRPRPAGRKRNDRGSARRDAALLPLFETLEDLTLLSSAIIGSVLNDPTGTVPQAGAVGVAGETVYLDLNHDHQDDDTTVTVPATSTTLATNTGDLGDVAGGKSSTLQVQNFPSQIADLQVNMDLANNGTVPITVGVFSPLGQTVPNLPTLFVIQPGEHFVGSFDQSATEPVTLASRPLAPGTYQPQQSFTVPQAHIYDGNPNGTWGLFFSSPNKDYSGLVLQSWSLTFKLPDPSATTDALGNYSFTGLAPGTYQVETLLAPGDIQTSPSGANAAQTVTVGDGQTVSGVDFGVLPASDLTAQLFYLTSPATSWGQPVTINYTLTNQGNGDAPAFNVAVELSNNGMIGTSGFLLQTLDFDGLAAHASTTGSVTVMLPATPPAGFGALDNTEVGFLIDPAHGLPHNDAAHDANQGLGVDSAMLATAPNVAVSSGSATQQDPSIAVDPTHPKHLVVAYMDASLVSTGYAGIGVAVSEDGGQTWSAETSIPLPAGFAQGAADPVVQFNAQGQVFVTFMAATFLGAQPSLTDPDSNEALDGFTSNNGIFVAQSTDGGLSWGNPVAVVSNLYNTTTQTPVFFDSKPDFAIDPGSGNLYVTWVRLYPAGAYPGESTATGGSDIMFAVSQNHGASFTTEMQTVPDSGGLQVSAIKDFDPEVDNGNNSPGEGWSFYPEVTVGPAGDIYVSAFEAGDFDVFYSSDGGQSFRAPAEQLGIPFTAAYPYPTLFYDQFRTNAVRDIVADPSDPGRVYVADAEEVYDAVVGGTIDSGQIIFAVSNDYGLTWDPITQVGDETTNLADLPPGEDDTFVSALNDDDGGRDTQYETVSQLNDEALDGQALPSMAIDAQGDLTVIWYDTRLDPVLQQSLDVYGTVSTDGGATFSPNFRISDASFNPNNSTDPTYLGDHIGVAAADGVAYAVWTTVNSDGIQQIESASYSLTQPPAPPVDRLSPDNTLATATNLGSISADIEVPRLSAGPGNDNWFRLQAGASGQVIATVTATTGDLADLQFQMTDANGDALAAVETVARDASGAVTAITLVAPSDFGDTFLLHVSTIHESIVPYALDVTSYTADLGASLEGTQSGVVEAGGQAVDRIQADVTGTIALTLTPGDAVSEADGFYFLVVNFNNQLLLGFTTDGSINLPVTQGDVDYIEVIGGGDDQESYTLQYTNLDQYETSGVTSPTGYQTLFLPTTGSPASVAVANLAGPAQPADIVVSSTNISDPVNVLMGNGDGTFQAPQQYDVGPGLSGALTAGNRQIGVADLTGNGVDDLIVPNFRGGNVSVLLGNGDGTFQPQRIFNAAPSPDSLVTGDFNGNGTADVAVLQNFPQLGGVSDLSILIGRGDGTFLPPVLYPTVFSDGAGPMVVGDFTGNGNEDILVFSKNQPVAELFLGNGNGTFTADPHLIDTGEDVFAAQAVEFNGTLGIVTTGTNSGNIYVIQGNGDGTFQSPQAFQAMAPSPGDNVGVYGLTVVPSGSMTGGPIVPGLFDLVVSAQSRSGAGSAEVLLLPAETDGAGNFNGYGPPILLANVASAGQLASGDFTGNGATDVVVTETGGVTVIYGTPPAIALNNTAATARALGSAAQLVTLPQAIVNGYENAYFTYEVPTEAVAGSGAEVIDFSALFQDVQGDGLEMDVTDTDGVVNVNGTPSTTGDRYRVIAPQGDVLTIHVFGTTVGDDAPSAGVYTLDIDVLPQIVSVQAESVVPGAPATSIVITLQGDRLDPTAAQDPANYLVTWLGPVNPQGASTGANLVIPVAATDGGQPVVYDPSANLDVASGLSYPTAVRQTVTLLFAQPLPPGNYQITLSPHIQAASYSIGESSLLADDASFDGHPLVSVQTGVVQNGAKLVVQGLVPPSGTTGNLNVLTQGTAFLTQLQNDLDALLNQLITENGDDPAITAELNNEVLARFAPLFASGSTAPSYTVIWFDPVSLALQSAQGQGVSYNLASNAVSNTASQTFVQVGGNVELVVLANAAGSYNLDVANVPAGARGGEVQLSADGSSATEYTDALAEGTSSFELDLSEDDSSGPEGSGTSPGGAITAAAQQAVTLLSTGVIGSPVLGGVVNPSNTTTEEEGNGSASEQGATTATGNTAVTMPLPKGATASYGSDDNSLINDESQLETLRPLVQSALQFVKKALIRASGVMNVIGLPQRSPTLRLWQGVINALLRTAAPAPAAGDGGPAHNEENAGRIPERPPAPPAVEPPAPPDQLDALDHVLRNMNVDGLLLPEQDLVDNPERDDSGSSSEAYLAVAFLAAGAYHARLRVQARSRSALGAKTHNGPPGPAC